MCEVVYFSEFFPKLEFSRVFPYKSLLSPKGTAKLQQAGRRRETVHLGCRVDQLGRGVAQ